ncbi:MAG: hypothetical protein JWQ02_1039 [Capsulimonas sp.]|nr:hypothetical protein [Capsulimonas sp.]
MENGTVVLYYRANMERYIWNSFTVNPPDVHIDHIDIRNEGEGVDFNVYTVGFTDFKEARLHVQPILNDFVDRLVVYFQRVISDPVFMNAAGSFSQPDGSILKAMEDSGYGNTLFSSSVSVGPMTLGPGHEEKMKEALLKAPPKENYYHRYRKVLDTHDKIDCFMSLYRLMEAMFSPEGIQAPIDNAIRQLRPGVPYTERPIDPDDIKASTKPAKYETLYTRLRNEVSHHRKGVDLATSRDEIRQHLGEFSILVKEAIERQPV